MDCPNCKNPLIILELAEIEIDYCTACEGIWLDAGELELLLEDSEKKDMLLNSFDDALSSDETKIKCPICRTKMKKVLVGEKNKITIDECKNNDGLWFDKGELLQVVQEGSIDQDNKVVQLLLDMFKFKINSNEAEEK